MDESQDRAAGDDSPAGIPVHRLAALHGGAVLAALALFGIADAWQAVSEVALAALYAVITGLLAGALLSISVHEWFHFLGARLAGGRYTRVLKPGLFVYNWDFQANDNRQFLLMSVAGSVGSIAALWLIAATLPADTGGRIAMQAAAWGNLVFATTLEWPVINRVRRGAAPLAALGTIDRRVLLRCAAAGLAGGLLAAWLLG